MVSVIIIQYNNSHLTKTAVETFLNFHQNNIEIILADNGSTESDIIETFARYPEINIVRSEKNLGFGAMNNLAAEKALGDILLFLNNDVIIDSEFINKIENEFSTNPAVGIIGPKLLNTDKTLQLSCGRLPSIKVEFLDKILYSFVDKKNPAALNYINRRFSTKEEMEWVTGAALFIRKDLFNEIGGFDETFFMYYEDKDLCARVKNLKHKILYFPDSSLVHIRGGSFDGPAKSFLLKKYRESEILYYRKHKSKLQQMILKLFLKLTGK